MTLCVCVVTETSEKIVDCVFRVEDQVAQGMFEIQLYTLVSNGRAWHIGMHRHGLVLVI
jgi:hypothetical protein